MNRVRAGEPQNHGSIHCMKKRSFSLFKSVQTDPGPIQTSIQCVLQYIIYIISSLTQLVCKWQHVSAYYQAIISLQADVGHDGGRLRTQIHTFSRQKHIYQHLRMHTLFILPKRA
jgi:hypothetical protein